MVKAEVDSELEVLYPYVHQFLLECKLNTVAVQFKNYTKTVSFLNFYFFHAVSVCLICFLLTFLKFLAAKSAWEGNQSSVIQLTIKTDNSASSLVIVQACSRSSPTPRQYPSICFSHVLGGLPLPCFQPTWFAHDSEIFHGSFLE